MALRITDTSPAKKPKKHYTVAEWLEMPAERPYTELVDGVVQKMPSGTPNHSQIIFNVRTVLASHLRGRPLGRVDGEINILIEGITGANGWIPDLAFAARDGRVQIGANWIGRPEWVLEVWAATEQKPQRIVEKRERWQQAGVPELWEVISGKEQIVNIYHLNGQDVYQRSTLEGEQICSQEIKDFCIDRSAIFADSVEESD